MDIEERDYEGYVRRIKQIDQIIEEPIASLVTLVLDGLLAGDPRSSSRPPGQSQVPPSGEPQVLSGSEPQVPSGGQPHVPSSVSQERENGPPSWFNTALCCFTLQRVFHHRRRFPGLDKDLTRLEKELRKRFPGDKTALELLAEPFLGQPTDATLRAIVADPYGKNVDPYTASHVFWVLLNSGERNAHTASGFFNFFFLLWALRRRFPAPGGVAVNSEPTAYVTAKCLAPLFILLRICRRRAKLLDEISKILRDLRTLMKHPEEPGHREWLPLRLNDLSGKLYGLSRIAIRGEGFSDCADQIGEIADRLSVDSNAAEAWAKVVTSVSRELKRMGGVASAGLREARDVVKTLLPTIATESRTRCSRQLEELGVHLPSPRFRLGSEEAERYWIGLADAADAASKVCDCAFELLCEASERCSRLPDELQSGDELLQEHRLYSSGQMSEALDCLLGSEGSSTTSATSPTIFDGLADANRQVADKIDKGMREAVQWCSRILTREIAYASASNLTEFDPAELLSALYVTVSGRVTDSAQLVTDAVGKALVGKRKDGSWETGQPFFVQSGNLGFYAPTSDILWMLSGTILEYPEVRVADDALGEYVNWLERTRKFLNYKSESGRPGRSRVFGWISERNLRANRIDVWATAFAVNALLGIRELMEFRLWEVCKQRFTVLEPKRGLSAIDPVDLGATHEYRLHRRLARMGRRAAGEEYQDADYSLIIHGPPGSSKTAIAEALAAEVWPMTGGRKARLIRITPADFTRKGEDRLDSEARIIFEVLSHVRSVTVLFDEIDDLLRVREAQGDPSFFKLVVPAMLNRLQDLRDACPAQEICFVLATNYVERIEPALIRRGRIDSALPLVYPDRASRRFILGKHLDGTKKEWAQWEGLLEKEVIQETDYWPWNVFDSLCKKTIGALGYTPDKAAGEFIRAEVIRRRAEVPEVMYDSERQKRLGRSAELRNELLQLSLAAGIEGDVSSLLTRLARLSGLKNWTCQEPDNGRIRLDGTAAGLLKTLLGESLQGKLEEIAKIRGWRAVPTIE